MNFVELTNEYYAKILLPASRVLLRKVVNNDLLTVDAVSYGFIASHFMDYIWEIKKTEAKIGRAHV